MVKKILGKSYILLILLFLYIPVFYIVFYSFTDAQVTGVWNGFSLNLYVRLFTGVRSAGIRQAVINTLILAFSAAAVSTVLGTVGAIGTFYSRRRTRRILNFTTNLPILNAEIVTSVSLSILFVSLSIDKGFGTLLVAHTVLCTPFVVLSVLPKLKQLNKNVFEAALDLGATPITAMTKVILPEIMPGIITGFILSITLSIDDFIFTIYNTFNYTTLTKFIYEDAKSNGFTPELRALSTLIFVIVFIVLIVQNLRNKNIKGKVIGSSFLR